MPGQDRAALRRELLELFARGADATLDDASFDALALRIFAYQFEHDAPYGAYCRRRGATPETVADWTRIPAVPTAAFKEVPLVTGRADDARVVFRTSGTTRGRERRGAHYVLDPELYRGSLVAGFRAFLLPDGASLPILSLVPPPADAPDSSLSYMAMVVMTELGADESGWYAGVDAGLDDEALGRSLRRFQDTGRPVCLFGTSLAFVHWLDRLRERDAAFRLPAGSRLMDTGGFKGHRRVVAEEELRASYRERLGIGETHAVNEYGMTELLSQYYDTALRDAGDDAARPSGPRRKSGPPWLRPLVVHPETLEPLPPGEVGILRHVDLANLDSVIAIQTEDLGRGAEGGFVLLGRATGAPPRGCSIAMDLLLDAAREAP